MSKHRFAEMAWTAVASTILMLLAWDAFGTGMEWLAMPLYAPGFLIAGIFFPDGFHSAGFLQVAFGLNFVFIWILLLAMVKLLHRFFSSKAKSGL
jgi:hypothetical protein